MIWDDAKSHLLYDLFMKKVDESFPKVFLKVCRG